MAQFGKNKTIPVDEREKDLSQKVFEALGAVSTCWENVSGAGTFESDKAKAIGDALMEEILEAMRSKWVSVRESDLGRQRQVYTQRQMLDLSQKKFMRILAILDHIDNSGQLDRFGEIREAVQATSAEVEAW
jgi:hypothetical protein